MTNRREQKLSMLTSFWETKFQIRDSLMQRLEGVSSKQSFTRRSMTDAPIVVK